ncbi:MAG: patatin-like phospholipase family protein [candidate division KSB1 bacterium]|nr:patatin-like phospholipase family protein [candidate division KSB1 bacterium]
MVMRNKSSIFVLVSFTFTSILLLPHLYGQAENNLAGKVRCQPSRPKIGLALSSGGARGLSHIGVLKALEENHIPVDLIAGTSMGSLIGGLYACGYSASEIETIVKGLDWLEIFEESPHRRAILVSRKYQAFTPLFRLRFRHGKPALPSGLLSGQRINQLLFELTAAANFAAHQDFDKLPTPFRSVTVDIETGEPVIMSRGNLFWAMRASMSIPFIFAPVRIDGRFLADGGVVGNMPTDVVKDMGADIILAVDVSSPLLRDKESYHLVDMINQVMKIWMVKADKLSNYPPDILIEPDLGTHSPLNYFEVDSLIKKGYEAAQARMAEIKAVVNFQREPDYRADWLAQAREKLNSAPISQIKVTGNRTVRESVILTEFGLKAGDLFNLTDALRGVENIYGMGLFENIWIDLENNNDQAKITINISEEEHKTLELGGNYRTEEGVKGFLELKNNNLLGYGGRLALNLQAGESKRLCQLRFQKDRIRSSNFTFNSQVYLDQEMPFTYSKGNRMDRLKCQSLGAELWTGLQLKRLGLTTIGLRMENTTLKPHPQLVPQEHIFRERCLVLRTIVDDLDDFSFPTKGRLHTICWESAFNILGSNTRFWRLYSEFNSFFTFKKRNTLSIHARLGFSKGALPLYHQFRLGGPETLWGFHRGELWGDQMYMLGSYYRFRVGRLVFPRVGFTAAQVWDDLNKTRARLKQTRWSIGGGVALLTLIGPISLDFGYGKGGRKQLYFSIGHIF